jgi:hypothetical protein
MNNLDSLINICIYQHDRAQQVKDCMSYYRQMFIMLRKKDDFTNGVVIDFQRLADYFYKSWIDIFKAPGVTNYIHMIGSGHIADFLKYYRNLYIHSQQGWEHFNSFLKVYFFCRTMRGGGKNNYSKIKPLAKWLARRLVWMTGITFNKMKEAVCTGVFNITGIENHVVTNTQQETEDKS